MNRHSCKPPGVRSHHLTLMAVAGEEVGDRAPDVVTRMPPRPALLGTCSHTDAHAGCAQLPKPGDALRAKMKELAHCTRRPAGGQEGQSIDRNMHTDTHAHTGVHTHPTREEKPDQKAGSCTLVH